MAQAVVGSRRFRFPFSDHVCLAHSFHWKGITLQAYGQTVWSFRLTLYYFTVKYFLYLDTLGLSLKETNKKLNCDL